MFKTLIAPQPGEAPAGVMPGEERVYDEKTGCHEDPVGGPDRDLL